MERELRDHLFACARAYAAATNRELTTVGKLATGDGRFFDRLTEGASFTARKYDLTLQWFSDNWPAGLDWPAEVVRPAATQTPGAEAA